MTIKSSVRVLIAVTYRAHREALVGTLRALRPADDIIDADPNELNQQVAMLQPDVVICSALSAVVESRVAAWVVLYPDEENRAVLGLHGRHWWSDGIDLAELVAFIDTAGTRSQA